MIKKVSLNSFNISKELIPVGRLKKYYEKFTPIQKSLILKQFESIEDYVNIYYYFKFEEQLNYRQIAKKMKCNVNSISRNYRNLGWKYEGNLDENEKKLNDMIQRISKLVSISEEELDKLLKDTTFCSYIAKYRTTYDPILNNLGLTSITHCQKLLFYLLKIQKLTTWQIATYYNIDQRYFQRRIKNLGLNKTHREGNIDAVKQRVREYDKIQKSRRKTTLEYMSEQFLIGSIKENYFRTYLAETLPEYINTQNYDVIVGVNTLNIREIDIPIMIYNISNGQVTRICVEYHGESFHRNDSDKKKNQLIQRGWKYIAIWDVSTNVELKNKFGTIDEQLTGCCNYIRKCVSS